MQVTAEAGVPQELLVLLPHNFRNPALPLIFLRHSRMSKLRA